MRGNILFKFIDRWFGIGVLGIVSTIIKKNLSTHEIKQPSNILIIKLSALGDSILLSPAIRAIRKQHPTSYITVICTAINKDVFLKNPNINEIIVFNPSKIIINPFYIFNIFHNKKFDIAFDFDQWLRVSAILTYLSGAPTRIGFQTKNQYKHFIFTHKVPHNPLKHEIDCFLDIIAAANIPSDGRQTEYPINDNITFSLIKKLNINKNSPIITIHTETPSHALQRRWPDEYYIGLIRKILSHYPKVKIALSPFTTNQISSENLKTFSKNYPENLILLPTMSLEEYASLLSISKILITPNTGIMHLGCAVGTNVIALHGPTDIKKWGPQPTSGKENQQCIAIKSKLECSPCLYLGFEYRCKTNKCMKGITVDEVFEEVRKLLDVN